jgi:hypothetical protein
LKNLDVEVDINGAWETIRDNIKISEIRWCGIDWIYLAQGRDQWKTFVNTVMNLRVP